jgi:hypothetical protein
MIIFNPITIIREAAEYKIDIRSVLAITHFSRFSFLIRDLASGNRNKVLIEGIFLG